MCDCNDRRNIRGCNVTNLSVEPNLLWHLLRVDQQDWKTISDVQTSLFLVRLADLVKLWFKLSRCNCHGGNNSRRQTHTTANTYTDTTHTGIHTQPQTNTHIQRAHCHRAHTHTERTHRDTCREKRTERNTHRDTDKQRERESHTHEEREREKRET